MIRGLMTGVMVPALIAGAVSARVSAGEALDSQDPGAASATLVVESTELAGMRSIPLIDSRKLKFSISSFAGCTADSKQVSALKKLSNGTLVPTKSSQSEAVPGDTELAVFAEYTNASGGNSVSCERALRFHSEPGKTYHVRYTPPRPWHRVSCDMTIIETRDGNELPVPTARDALLENKGFWKGSDLNICAASGHEDQKPEQ